MPMLMAMMDDRFVLSAESRGQASTVTTVTLTILRQELHPDLP
jgi:hypothetical protein